MHKLTLVFMFLFALVPVRVCISGASRNPSASTHNLPHHQWWAVVHSGDKQLCWSGEGETKPGFLFLLCGSQKQMVRSHHLGGETTGLPPRPRQSICGRDFCSTLRDMPCTHSEPHLCFTLRRVHCSSVFVSLTILLASNLNALLCAQSACGDTLGFSRKVPGSVRINPYNRPCATVQRQNCSTLDSCSGPTGACPYLAGAMHREPRCLLLNMHGYNHVNICMSMYYMLVLMYTAYSKCGFC